jgi:glucose/arabinose dehydrogenase/mono/diheme cytochrome c family protein
MRFSTSYKTLSLIIVAVAALWAGSSWTHAAHRSSPAEAAEGQGCPNDDSGLALPAGFCATVFADGIGHARHLVVSPSGVVYVNTWSGRYYGNDTPHAGGFLVALQDTKGSGKANVAERFGETVASGGAGGTGIALYKGSIYAEINDRIVRYPLAAGSIASKDSGVTIVSGLPLTGDHPMHPFIINSKGELYVDVATPSNSCQLKNRTLQSPGAEPCKELETRGGIWLYDANKTNQVFSPAERFATGIRNGEGFAIDAAGRMFGTQHGRDQLHANWPDLYKPDQEATLPAEQMMLLKKGDDYGWPECYFDPFVEKLVLAPEYGGDGGKKIGVCADKIAPVAAFPAHWAPNGMVHYDKKQFPERYRNGVFIAFHGSWDRAPYPQAGYNVVFQPLSGDHASGQCEVFADGFAGAIKSPDKAAHRPSGLAVGPEGSLYVSDDVAGRIYRIVYLGGSANAGGKTTSCPSATAPAGEVAAVASKPPEGTNPDAAAAANTSGPVPPGATLEMVALGAQIYRGQVGGAACTGCHGQNGQGTVLGPDLTGKKWLWGDGSYAAITKTITDGVSQPKQFRSPMPPMGGAQLSAEQVSAVAAYVWSLSHKAQ